jgi:hypothetical protein
MGQKRKRQESHLECPSPRPVFHQVFILKVVKVFCFDTLLEVFILKGLRLHQNCATVVSLFVLRRWTLDWGYGIVDRYICRLDYRRSSGLSREKNLGLHVKGAARQGL